MLSIYNQFQIIHYQFSDKIGDNHNTHTAWKVAHPPLQEAQIMYTRNKRQNMAQYDWTNSSRAKWKSSRAKTMSNMEVHNIEV